MIDYDKDRVARFPGPLDGMSRSHGPVGNHPNVILRRKRLEKCAVNKKSNGSQPSEAAPFVVEEPQVGTILAAMRQWLPGESWSAVRKLLRGRHILINGTLCVDEGRRLTIGETVTITEQPNPTPPGIDDVVVRLVDRSIVVAEKPPGMITVRHKAERRWSAKRRLQQPTLDESVAMRIARHASSRSQRGGRVRTPRLLAVHRLDRDTSGLVVFARNDDMQQALIKQFAEHRARRVYLAIIMGRVNDQMIRTRQVRDRGDGLRGNTSDPVDGQEAITHIRTIRRLEGYSELECRLETGRTNQIRIHLSELGHPICGDIKYRGPLETPSIKDHSRCPRLALHAAELSFKHPESRKPISFEWAWPEEMLRFIKRLETKNV